MKQMWEIIFYLGCDTTWSHKLLRRIQEAIGPLRIQIPRSIDDLFRTFRSPYRGSCVLILMPKDNSELKDLIGMADMIIDLPILLVLPDNKPSTVSLGHKLYPRFIAYRGGGSSEIVSVLTKLLKNRQKPIGLSLRTEPPLKPRYLCSVAPSVKGLRAIESKD